MDMSLSKLQETVKVRVAWHVAVYGVPKSWTWWLRNNNNLQKKKKKIRVALVKCGKRTQRHSCFAPSLFPPAPPCILTQSCLTVCDPMDHSPPGSSFYGIFQARILEWVAISFSRWFFPPRNLIQVSCITGKFFTKWAMRKSQILEWIPMPSSRGSFQPRDRTQVSCIVGRFITSWATREVQNHLRSPFNHH